MTAFSFPRLLAPVDPARFLSEYWERAPLLVQRGDPQYFGGLFSSTELESVLQHVRPQGRDLRVVRDQVELSPLRYTQPDGSLHMNQLYKAYAEGHTLVVNGLQRFVPKLHRLARELQEMLCFKVELNVYLTPAGSKGLHPHYDTHDVFVLQVEGRKTWNLWGCAQEAPLLHSFQPVIPVDGLGAPERIVELAAGDMLYLPRGHVHDAATQQEHSMHITVGVYPTQWLDLAIAALSAQAQRDARWRKAVPIGYLNRSERWGEVQEQLARWLAEFAGRPLPPGLFDGLTEELIRDSQPLADGQLDSLNAAAALRGDSRLVRRDHMRCRVLAAEDGVRIQFAGNVIKASADYRAALAQVAECEQPLRVDELAGLDPGRQLLLAQRLVRGGLLRVLPEGGA